ncbi:MAG: S41 family peptidase [Bacteroidota bacterium]
MNRTFFILCTILALCASFKKDQDKLDNLITFAKAYGYVKYFHPSDEASGMDWNIFAAYGAEEILKCNSKTEVITTLNNLFKPIAPSVLFSEEQLGYDINTITPENPEGYKTTYWQHKGVSKGMNYNYGIYKSSRVNSYSEVDESDGFGNLTTSIAPEKYKGKQLKYTAWAKVKEGSKGTGHLWLRVDKEDKTIGFFENMDGNPIKINAWKQYEIVTDVDSIASNVVFGCFIKGKGTMYVDDVHLYYKEDNEWIEIPIKNGDFETNEIVEKNERSQWSGNSKGYTYTTSNIKQKEGNRCAVITYEGRIKRTKGESIFEAFPKFGEIIEKEIGNNIYCQIPLNLYWNDEGTYPKSKTLTSLQNSLDTLDLGSDNLALRLGNVINTYNVFQHFYPYFKEVDVDWDKELEIALNRSFNDKSDLDHHITLQKFTSPLKDGHIWVRGANTGKFQPPINWQLIENKLIITDVFCDSFDVHVGDMITKIDGRSIEDHFREIKSTISAGTDGWSTYLAQGRSMFGKKDTELTIEVNNKTITLKRDGSYTNGVTEIPIQKNTFKKLDQDIYYLNLSKIPMDTITQLLPELKQANGIICDMRGYPAGNHELISHLLNEKDTSNSWMRIPKIIYPDQENITGYENHGWDLEPKEPYLGDKKVVFITDGRAISYAESYMGFIEGYNLATIVGQPTAGTNGNLNSFNLLGDFYISWTGMKVLKHDGSQHHAIGVLPDIYVTKTVEGVKSGKDEFLEKAIEVILE